ARGLVIRASDGRLFAANRTEVFEFASGIWTQLSDIPGMATRMKVPLVIHPLTDELYAGNSDGVWKYSGGSWSPVTGGVLVTNVNSLAFNVSGTHLYAGTNGDGVFEYASSSWTDLSTPNLTNKQIVEIAVHPTSGKLYVGTYIGPFFSYDGIDWTRITALPSGGKKLSPIAINSLTGKIFAATHPSQVFRSDDDGGSWSLVTNGLPSASFMLLATYGASTVYIGSPGVYRSMNDGDNWSSFNDGLVATDVSALAIHSAASGRLLAGMYGEGTAYSDDNGVSWTVDNTGLTNTWVTTAAYTSSGRAFVGTEGSGIFYSDGGTWSSFSTTLPEGAEIVYALAVPREGSFSGKILAGTAAGLIVSSTYSEIWNMLGVGTDIEGVEVRAITLNAYGHLFVSANGELFRSTNHGIDWSGLEFPPGLTEYSPLLALSNGNLLAGSQDVLWRSIDNGSNWNEQLVTSGEVTSLAEGQDGYVFAGTIDGQVWVSQDFGTTWENKNSGLPVLIWIKAIAANATGEVFLGTEGAGVYRSTQFIKPFSIRGKVFDDANTTCAANQIGLKGWKVQARSTSSTYWDVKVTDDNGLYKFTLPVAGTYEVKEGVKDYWDHACPLPDHIYTINYDGITPITGIDFGNRRQSGIFDVSIDVAGGIARPGRIKQYGIKYENKGTEPANNVTVKFYYPENTTYQYDAYPPHTSVNEVGREIIWELGTIGPGDIGWISLSVLLEEPPTFIGGEHLTSTVKITTTDSDVYHKNNDDQETQVVVNSWDPNQKLVTPVGIGPYGYILVTDTLRYHIDFQNVGTDTAFNIVIRDTLDSDLDLFTFNPGASSHPYTYDIQGDGAVTFTFADIMLPDSNVNEPGSQGFVEFKIVPLPGTPVGSDILNRAGIYFDFNPPVMTNTVQNRIGSFIPVSVSPGWNMLSVPLIVTDYAKVKLYPTSISDAFKYAGSYVPIDTLSNGIGFWLKFPDETTIQMLGSIIEHDTIDVNAGWNMIGSISYPVDIDNIVEKPDLIVISNFFEYNGTSYVIADTIHQGKAYWVKTQQSGQLIMSSSGTMKLTKTRVRFNVDELPPPTAG
ncbi:MAG: hypothetical protein QME52_07955, partial [Bacteroidota bacterium]|nr:hypothetical protein [Bacteroidota bacterium]